MTIKELAEMYEMMHEVKNVLDIDLTKEEMEELADGMQTSDDFTLELDGMEFRFITEDSIRETAQEEIWEIVKDCYLDGKDMPWWIDIDERKTVQNCIDADGYGHHFSSYDGSEYEIATAGTIEWYAFRTN